MAILGVDDGAHPLLHLQRTIGNKAVTRMLQAHAEETHIESTAEASLRFGHDVGQIPVHPPAEGGIQTKLAIKKSEDRHEQEADSISEQVMRISCASGGGCTKCRTEQPGRGHERLHAKRAASGDCEQTTVPPIVHEVLCSPGQPLDLATRVLMEPRFGHAFAKVRVHTHNRAAESAEAVNALAYTVGDNIALGAGQYGPGSSRRQQLLAHELTHVVQQNGAKSLHGEFAGRPDISRAPAGLVSRKASAQDENQKKDAVKWHVTQQLHVAALLDKARKIKPAPAKGPLDADNLYHNSVEMVDNGRILLSILTPIHDWQTRKPGELAYFDWHVKYPKTGGDYPADPAIKDIMTGLAFADPLTTAAASMPSVTAPGFVELLTKKDLITEDELKRDLVHEAQHIADLGAPKRVDPTLEPWERTLEVYKTEFRAHWIQPVSPPVRQGGEPLAQPSASRLGSPSDPAENKQKLSQDCTTCPAPTSSDKPGKSTPGGTKTNFKNRKQEKIFWHLLSRYPAKQFDCFYVCSPEFKKAVDAFDVPASANLINSARLMKLNLELLNLKQSMTRVEVDKTAVIGAVRDLDALDWAFLQDGKLSAPFWAVVDINGPVFLRDGMKALAKRGTSVNAIDIDKALSGKLSP